MIGNKEALPSKFNEPDVNPFVTRFEQMLSWATSVNEQALTFKVRTFAGIVGNAVNDGQLDTSNDASADGNVESHKFKLLLFAKDIETMVVGNESGGDEIDVLLQNR